MTQLAIWAKADLACTVSWTGFLGPSSERLAEGGSTVMEPEGGVITTEKLRLLTRTGL